MVLLSSASLEKVEICYKKYFNVKIYLVNKRQVITKIPDCFIVVVSTLVFHGPFRNSMYRPLRVHGSPVKNPRSTPDNRTTVLFDQNARELN